jgi:hypothetical protein
MRGNQDFQGAMFSYISLEERVPQSHLLCKLRAVVDALLVTMSNEFEAVGLGLAQELQAQGR